MHEMPILESYSEHDPDPVLARALTLVEERHGATDEKNPYHFLEHTKGVERQALRVAHKARESGVPVDEEQMLAIRTAARFHDSVVFYFMKDGVRVRLRGIASEPNEFAPYRMLITPGRNEVEVFTHAEVEGGVVDKAGKSVVWDDLSPIVGNEEASWLEAKAYMDQDPQKYTPRVQTMVQRGIYATYPRIAMRPLDDTRHSRVSDDAGQSVDVSDKLIPKENTYLVLDLGQPTLDGSNNQDAELEEISVGIADIAYGTYKEFEQVFDEANRELREWQQWIADALAEHTVEELESAVKVRMARAILNGWIGMQTGVLVGQKERIFDRQFLQQKIFKDHPKFVEAMREECGKIDPNIVKMHAKAVEMDGGRNTQGEKFDGIYTGLKQEDAYPQGDALMRRLLREVGYTLRESDA